MASYIEKMKTVPVRIKVLAVMNHKRNDRVFKLEAYETRCVMKHEMHEFIIIDDAVKAEGAYYIGFAEMITSGVIYKGMKVTIGNKYIGKVIGFDYRHMPNHINIILENDNKKTGVEMGIETLEEGIMVME